MKNLILFSFIIVSFAAKADQKIVPLDIDLGHWESTVDMQENEQVKKMLAGVPESQRAMVEKMMKGMAPKKISQCVTQETLNDAEKQLKDSMGKAKGQSCEFTVTKSTSKELIGEMNCQGVPTTVHTKVINAKRHESYATSRVPGQGESKVKIVGEWKSATCPAGL